MNPAESLAILIISHGSPRASANQAFTAMVQRVAARLEGQEILPAFFSIARPNIPDQIAALAAQGVRRVVLMPYFLCTGQHVSQDIPALLVQCRQQFPDVTLELLPTLENEPALEDIVVERLVPLAPQAAALPSDGAAIQRRSFEIIGHHTAGWECVDPAARRILRRVIHATADVSFARTLRIHPEAAPRGRQALAAGRPIVCDVRMLQAGITRAGGEVLCAIDRDDVTDAARRKGSTRAAAAIEALAPNLQDAIVAVGNAPTALWKVLELARNGLRPALVVGLPVGFVGARESKLALLQSDLCYITNTSPRGGSPVAAAAVNALATLDEEEL